MSAAPVLEAVTAATIGAAAGRPALLRLAYALAELRAPERRVLEDELVRTLALRPEAPLTARAAKLFTRETGRAA